MIIKQVHNHELVKAIIKMELIIEVNYNYLPKCLYTQQMLL